MKPCFPTDQHDHDDRRRPKKRSRDTERDISIEEDFDDGEVMETHSVDCMDGATYLSQVRAEANRLPQIFTASALVNHQQQNQRTATPVTSHITTVPGSAASAARYLISNATAVRRPPTSHHTPANGRVWVERTLENFDRLRKYLNECRDSGVADGTKEPSRHNVSVRVPVPAMKETSDWHVFCVGDDDACGNAGGYFHDDDEDKDEAESSDTHSNNTTDENHHTQQPAWKRQLPPDGTKPSVSLLLQMDQVMVRRVLEHLTHYIVNGFAARGQRALWLYALLARLECPIHRNDAVTLYTLLKQMTLLREQMPLTDCIKKESMSNMLTASSGGHCLASLNTLIAIVGIYFEQGGGYANVMEVESP